MSMKVALFLVHSVARFYPALRPALLPVREWQLLSIGYLTSCGVFLLAGALGGDRPWVWFGAGGSAAIAWIYFAASRGEASQHGAA